MSILGKINSVGLFVVCRLYICYNKAMENEGTILNTPANLADFKGQFVVFFTEDTNPTVLFNTFIAEEAYKKAEEIKNSQNREPVVFRVQENISNNISQVLEMHCLV